MIIGDKNRKLLVTEQDITIVRGCSIIKYDNEYNPQAHAVALEFPKVFKNKTYEYTGDKLISLHANEQRNISLGQIIDYFKVEKDFFFLKENKTSKTMHNTAGECLLKFNSTYHFESPFLYFIEDDKFHRFNLLTLERSEIELSTSIKNNVPVIFCCKCEDRHGSEIVVFADYLNKIYIHNRGKCRLYHWISNKIVHLSVYDRYVVAVSKKGDVVRFHIDIQKIEPLFNFYGVFADISYFGNKLYLLTDFEFIVFDFVVSNIIVKNHLIGSSDYKVSMLETYSDKGDDSDIFSIKRHSKVEIMNLIYYGDRKKHKEVASSSGIKEHITYVLGKCLFIVDAQFKKVVSIFKLEDRSVNFVCGSSCFAFIQRKSTVILKTFKVFIDRIIQTRVIEFPWRGKLDIKDVFIDGSRVYLLISQCIYVVNKMGFLEVIYSHRNCKSFEYFEDYACVIDEKGIFNIVARKYDVFQKKIVCCCMFKNKLAFYIEDKGIYCDKDDDSHERYLILEIKNVLDMKARSGDILEVLQCVEGKCMMGEYSLEDGGLLAKRNEVIVENQASKILIEKLCVSKSNVMLG